jgi:hypothetical protein
MEKARRISPSWYMNFGLIRDSGKRVASGIIDASSKFPPVD